MKALVKRKAEPGLWLEDVPIPAMEINDVLIKVLRTGICGTDLHIYNWDDWAQQTIPVPMVVGHEFVGEVVDVSPDLVLWAAQFYSYRLLVKQHLRKHGQATASELRMVTDTTRRIVIPLLEKMAREGITVRRGNVSALR